MSTFSILTLFGHDRPGIVARITRILFEQGCNIEDSSMTRLGGQFTIMLILKLPAGISPQQLKEKMAPAKEELKVCIALHPMISGEHQPPPHDHDTPHGEGCIVTVLGSDKPGIVYRVAEALAAENANIADLSTHLIGTPEKPVYAMVIEAEHRGELDSLQERMTALSGELGVEIKVRSNDTFEL